MVSTALFHYLVLLVAARIDRLSAKVTRLIGWLHGVRSTISPDEERKVLLRDGTSRVLVHIYRNQAARRLRLQGGMSPVLLNWHGGGWIIHRQGQDRTLFEYLFHHHALKDHPITIIDANYSHAPEHPFPAAIHDAIDVTSWVFANTSLEWDTSKVVLNGFSAGGNLALCTSASFGKNGANPIKAVVAFYPPCDASKPHATAHTCRPTDPKTLFPGFVIPDSRLRLFYNSYFHTHIDPAIRKSPIASPYYADAKTFPAKVLLFTCEYDTLRDEGEAMRKKLKAGPDVRGWMVRGVGHSWEHAVGHPGHKGYPEKREAYNAVADLLAEMFGE